METLTLRDRFAIAAMQGELAAQGEDLTWANEKYLAARAYEVADAMLAERSKYEQTKQEQLNSKCPVNVDWDDAPDWANYWLVDQQGSFWFEQEPVLKNDIYFGSDYSTWKCEMAPSFDFEMHKGSISHCYQARPKEPSHG